MFRTYTSIKNNVDINLSPEQRRTNNRRFYFQFLTLLGFIIMFGCYIYSSTHGIHLEVP